MIMLGGLRSGTSTLIAEVSGGNIGYSNEETGIGIVPQTFGSLNVSPAQIAVEGNYVIDLYTASTTLYLTVRGALNRVGYSNLVIGGSSYSFASASTVSYGGGAFRYQWSGATALVDGQSYKLSVS